MENSQFEFIDEQTLEHKIHFFNELPEAALPFRLYRAEFEEESRTFLQVFKPYLWLFLRKSRGALSTVGQGLKNKGAPFLKYVCLFIAEKLKTAVADLGQRLRQQRELQAQQKKEVLITKAGNKQFDKLLTQMSRKSIVLESDEPLVEMKGRWQILSEMDQQMKEYLYERRIPVRRECNLLPDDEPEQCHNTALMSSPWVMNYIERLDQQQLESLNVYELDNDLLRIPVEEDRVDEEMKKSRGLIVPVSMFRDERQLERMLERQVNHPLVEPEYDYPEASEMDKEDRQTIASLRY